MLWDSDSLRKVRITDQKTRSWGFLFKKSQPLVAYRNPRAAERDLHWRSALNFLAMAENFKGPSAGRGDKGQPSSAWITPRWRECLCGSIYTWTQLSHRWRGLQGTCGHFVHYMRTYVACPWRKPNDRIDFRRRA